MPRVKRGVMHSKRRRNLLAQTKGYMWGRKSKIKLAKVAVLKAGVNAYRDRRLKKRDMRALWALRINAAARENGMKYSTLIDAMKKAGIVLDRKVLSELAAKHPAVFAEVVKAAKK
ncbi:MAG: 50S ribosomal protein L20 [Parcubacteria group bacterium]|nr:50S ribosomal protein L20 [Parcubacteria group bacterium]MBI4457416.1 50S ribosomal protein L20 [Candidatus Uhrbacteria bacterium]